MNYYNYRLDEVMDLDYISYSELLELMRINIARDELRMVGAAAYPNLKPQSAKQYHKELYKKAYPSQMEVKNVVKLGDIKKVLK